MINQQMYARNEEWIPPVRLLLRAILGDYRETTGIPTLRMRMDDVPDQSNAVYPIYRPEGTPFLPSQYCRDQFTALRAFHNLNYPDHKVTLRFGSDLPLIQARTFYMPPTNPVGAPLPSPSPYDLPDPYPLPPQCIPCIGEVLIA